MINYAPLFRTLDHQNLKLIDVERKLGLSSSTTSKFRKGEAVSLTTIEKICILLDVPIEEVVEIQR